MSDRLYPISIQELDVWRRQNQTTLDEARKRFVQFVVLESIASSPLREDLAFKGGNALRFTHRSPRSTIDLDFTAVRNFPDSPDEIRNLLDSALRGGERRSGLRLRTQKVRRDPKDPKRTRPTYSITVAFQFPGDRRYNSFDEDERPIASIIKMEISINDVVCETAHERLGPSADVLLKVCVLDDIVAEKLRAILQQRPRNRFRRQDVYDIARIMRADPESLDFTKIASFFKRKCEAREIDPKRSAFDDEIRTRAKFEYETLFDEGDADFIHFDEAWADVLMLVDRLDIEP